MTGEVRWPDETEVRWPGTRRRTRDARRTRRVGVRGVVVGEGRGREERDGGELGGRRRGWSENGFAESEKMVFERLEKKASRPGV